MDDRNFNELTAKEWIETIEGAGAKVRENDLYPHMREWFDQIKPESVLDIGCGQGACSQALNLGSCRYVGVDPSSHLIERAATLFPQRRFVLGNAYALPFADQSFDAAFAIAVWHLLEDKKKASVELSRVLKKGGAFLIATANPDRYEDWTKMYFNSVRDGSRFEGIMRTESGEESKDVLFLHSFEEIAEALRVAGLPVEETSTFRTVLSIRGVKEND